MMSTLKLQQSQIELSIIRNKSRGFGRKAPRVNHEKIIIAQNRALTQIKYEQTHTVSQEHAITHAMCI